MSEPIPTKYENNPFYIGLHGLQLLFKNAQSVAIYAIVLVGVSLLIGIVANVIDFVSNVDDSSSSSTYEVSASAADPNVALVIVAVVAIVALVVLLYALFLLCYGILEYTGARLALGETVTLKQAFKDVLRRLPGYLWVYIIMTVKIFLWSLLLIVPGIIMAVRYKLAGTAYFAEDKRGNAAIKRSLELTKGAWFTTFAGFGLWDLITLNQITPLIAPGSAAILYRQLRMVTDSGAKKPAAHWLSWLTFFGPLALFILFAGMILLLVVAVWATLAP